MLNILDGIRELFRYKPSKHAKAHRKPKDWREKRRTRRLMAKASRRKNRR